MALRRAFRARPPTEDAGRGSIAAQGTSVNDANQNQVPFLLRRRTHQAVATSPKNRLARRREEVVLRRRSARSVLPVLRPSNERLKLNERAPGTRLVLTLNRRFYLLATIPWKVRFLRDASTLLLRSPERDGGRFALVPTVRTHKSRSASSKRIALVSGAPDFMQMSPCSNSR